MTYAGSTLPSSLERLSSRVTRRLEAVGRHAATSHQVLLALAFLWWWGTTQGVVAKLVMLALALDLLECWVTTEDRIEMNKDWKVRAPPGWGLHHVFFFLFCFCWV